MQKKADDQIKKEIFFMTKKVFQYRDGYYHWKELTEEEQNLSEIVSKIATK